MVFSSPIFLFCFLPLSLTAYFLAPARWRNALLLVLSLAFYLWGETGYGWVMPLVIAVSYAAGRWIGATADAPQRKRRLWWGVGANLGLLLAFKYLDFLTVNLNHLLWMAGLPMLPLPDVPLPLGISFFVFHAISYLVDVYRRNAEPQRSPGVYALYLALFPQLIAGPIIRYKDIAAQLLDRRSTADDFAAGWHRFVFGLGKKVLLANPLGAVASEIFALPGSELTMPMAWLGAVCYTLQIYFDFSGYSDMAIGLMRMFGFRIAENFNYPYVADSVRDFWRRWHISLSTWFRDYVYLPLGGNRVSPWRVNLNLLAVFLLCGIWHGAAWTFVLWGIFHGSFLVLERGVWGRWLARLPRVLRTAYVLLVVHVGWVLFAAATLPDAMAMLGAMFTPASGNAELHGVGKYLTPHVSLVLAAALLGATPWWRRFSVQRETAAADSPARNWAQSLAMWGVLLPTISALAANTYNPFIYFRF